MDDFKCGVKKFMAFIEAESEQDMAEAHFEWRCWADDNKSISFDAQSEARKQYASNQEKSQ